MALWVIAGLLVVLIVVVAAGLNAIKERINHLHNYLGFILGSPHDGRMVVLSEEIEHIGKLVKDLTRDRRP